MRALHVSNAFARRVAKTTSPKEFARELRKQKREKRYKPSFAFEEEVENSVVFLDTSQHTTEEEDEMQRIKEQEEYERELELCREMIEEDERDERVALRRYYHERANVASTLEEFDYGESSLRGIYGDVLRIIIDMMDLGDYITPDWLNMFARDRLRSESWNYYIYTNMLYDRVPYANAPRWLLDRLIDHVSGCCLSLRKYPTYSRWCDVAYILQFLHGEEIRRAFLKYTYVEDTHPNLSRDFF